MPAGGTGVDAAWARLVSDRYLTTARFMRNLAADPDMCAEVSKKHAVDMLLWFAKQSSHACSGLYRSADTLTAVSPPLQGSARVAGDTGPAPPSPAGAASPAPAPAPVPAPRGAAAGSSGRLDVRSVPLIYEFVSQTVCLLTRRAALRKSLVSRGVLHVVAKLLDMAVRILSDAGVVHHAADASATRRGRTVDGAAAYVHLALRVCHRMAVALMRLSADTEACAKLVVQGKLSMSLLSSLLDVVSSLHTACSSIECSDGGDEGSGGSRRGAAILRADDAVVVSAASLHQAVAHAAAAGAAAADAVTDASDERGVRVSVALPQH
jgi:hypothetical protein